MRIQFEIKEKLPEIIEEIMNSGKWQTSVKEELSGRTTVVIRDQAYGSEATIEIYAKSIEINKCHRGDIIAIRSAGAYGEVMASQYNCRELPKGYITEEL